MTEGGTVFVVVEDGGGRNPDMDATSLKSESLGFDTSSVLVSPSLKAVSCRSRSMSSTFTGPFIDVILA